MTFYLKPDGELNEINSTFNEILTNASGIGNNTFDFNNYGEDVGKILDEASWPSREQAWIYQRLPEEGVNLGKSRSVKEHSH